jgi:hypothetical protein
VELISEGKEAKAIKKPKAGRRRPKKKGAEEGKPPAAPVPAP